MLLLFAVTFNCCMIGDWSLIPKLSFVAFFELRRANGTRKISSLALSITISSVLGLGRMNHNEHCTRAYSSWVRFRSHSRPQSLRFFRSRGRRRRVAPGTRMFHSQSPSLSKTAFQQSRRNSEVWRRNPMKNRAISDVYGERPCNRIALRILHFFCILKYLKI